MTARDVTWAVSSGCYSDYRVHATFGNKATAEAWRKAMNGDAESWGGDYRVEALPHFPAGTKPRKVTTYTHHVEMWDDGSINDVGITSRDEWEADALNGPPPLRPSLRFVRAPIHNNRGGRMEVVGSTAESVEKVVHDRLRMWRAGAWVTKKLNEFNMENADERGGA